jgi:hypothetical protein
LQDFAVAHRAADVGRGQKWAEKGFGGNLELRQEALDFAAHHIVRADLATLTRVMAFMQGPGLLIVAPLIVCFFAGGAVLSIALARAGVVPAWNPWLHVRARCRSRRRRAGVRGTRPPEDRVGLTVLALFTAPQVWAGLAIARGPSAVRPSAGPLPEPGRLRREVVALGNAGRARGGRLVERDRTRAIARELE